MKIAHGSILRAALPILLCGAIHAETEQLYIGTYTNTDAHSRGIYSVMFNSNTGALSGLTVAAETTNPSFLVRHPSLPILYAVNETPDGAVSSFVIGPNGALAPLGSSSTKGASPCHLAVDRSGKWLLVANYNGGNVAVLPIMPDGKTGEAMMTQHSGSGPSPRQKAPHPHEIVELADGVVLVPDLGADRIVRYRLDKANGRLSPADPPEITLPPGTGPRHLAATQDGKTVYLLSEIASTIAVLVENHSRKNWDILQTVSMLPADFQGRSTAAEIALHPNGRFLYASNRGADNIVVFSIDAATKKLTKVDAAPTGAIPRFFTLDRGGKWLLAAGQNSGTITVFAIDPVSGKLTAEANPLKAPAPVFIGR